MVGNPYLLGQVKGIGVTVKFMKKISEIKSEKNSLVKMLDSQLSGYDHARSFKGLLHASALTNELEFCPREAALLDVTHKQRKDHWVSTALRVTYEQGRSLENMARNEWLRPFAIGQWKCGYCGNSTPIQHVPAGVCKCLHRDWKYIEPHLQVSAYGIQCSLDVVIDFGDGLHQLAEIKTIVKDDFAKLVAPLAEHRQRTVLYLWLVRKMPLHIVNPNRGKVLYISKAYGKKNDEGIISPFREFDVQYNADLIKTPLAKAKRLKMFRDGLSGIPKGICTNSFVPRVKKCACPQECWSGKYPAQETPLGELDL